MEKVPEGYTYHKDSSPSPPQAVGQMLVAITRIKHNWRRKQSFNQKENPGKV